MLKLAYHPKFTPEEYLESEREADYRSEYFDGEIYAMAGSTAEHATLCGNIGGLLFNELRGRKCRHFNSDMKVWSGKVGKYFVYPDITVVCGDITYYDDKRDIISNPTLIIEVLSSSTEQFDRGLKFSRYQRIPSLTDYVLVSQHEARVEHFRRTSERQWVLSVITGLDEDIHLASIDCTLKLVDIYERIEFHADE